MARHDPLIDDKLESKGWDALRPVFSEIHGTLLSADAAASSKAETIYIKYRLKDDVYGKVFAVVWIRTTKRLTVGLALPDDIGHPLLGPQPPRMNFPPLNRFFVVEQGGAAPEELSDWAKVAYKHVTDLVARGDDE